MLPRQALVEEITQWHQCTLQSPGEESQEAKDFILNWKISDLQKTDVFARQQIMHLSGKSSNRST